MEARHGRTLASLVAAALLCGMAGAAAYGLATGPGVTKYAALLVGSVVLATAATALGLCLHRCVESQLAAVLLAVLTIVGQVLTMTVGQPGASAGHWHVAGLAVVGLGAAVLLLVGVDARLQARTQTRPRPYAL